MLWDFYIFNDERVFLQTAAGNGKQVKKNAFSCQTAGVFGHKVKPDWAAAPLLSGHLIKSQQNSFLQIKQNRTRCSLLIEQPSGLSCTLDPSTSLIGKPLTFWCHGLLEIVKCCGKKQFGSFNCSSFLHWTHLMFPSCSVDTYLAF